MDATRIALCAGFALSVSVCARARAQTHFGPPTEYALWESPHSVCVADLDGDGDRDLAVANRETAIVSVLLNSANGTFGGNVDYTVAFGPGSISAADLDGDGDADLAAACEGSGALSILFNDGDGTFTPELKYDAGALVSISSADLDRDGDSDLAFTEHVFLSSAGHTAGGVSVLLNDGDGTFPGKVHYETRGGAGSVSTADLDGDGNTDVAASNGGLTEHFPPWMVSVFLNDGGGALAGPAEYATGEWPTSLFCADLDGGGDHDIAAANMKPFGDVPSTVSVLLNNGDGTLVAQIEYPVGDSPHAVSAGDLDGDGDSDLATANTYGESVSILLNDGDGTFPDILGYPAGDSPRSLAIADLDGDGDGDLAVVNRNGVAVLLNQLVPTAVVEQQALDFSAAISLQQNFPNPFNSTTTIQYALPKAAAVQLRLLDSLGQEVRSILNEYHSAGHHTVRFDGRNSTGQTLSSGIYFLELRAEESALLRKIVFLR